MNRRNILTAAAAGLLGVPVAVPTGVAAAGLDTTPAGPDADLLALVERHIANHRAYNELGGNLECERDPLWIAYDSTCTAIDEAKPHTLAGIVAKARAAKVEASLADGAEAWENGVAGDWAWDLVNDLLRLGGAA